MRDLKKRIKVSFPILSDPKLRVIRAFGVEHKGSGIALPAVFLIDSQGQISWRQISKNVIQRASENSLLQRAQKLAKQFPTSQPKRATPTTPVK